jgi:hypothetical protein
MNLTFSDEILNRFSEVFSHYIWQSTVENAQRSVMILLACEHRNEFSDDQYFKKELRPLFMGLGEREVIACLNELRGVVREVDCCSARKAISESRQQIELALQQLEQRVCGSPRG